MADTTNTFTLVVNPCGQTVCRASLVIEGILYECSCGEFHYTIEDAISCRKCRTYAPEGWCEDVYDIRTGSIVWSRPVCWDVELDGALDKPRHFAPTLADVWPASL